ncbi:MAG: hypothetical protein RI932_1973 [Pseudomonadota bacterium]|jgi:adenine-specific DNA-methyltransferase
MLELVWPGKTQTAQQCLLPSDKTLKPWTPRTSPELSSASTETSDHRIIAGDNLDALRFLRDAGHRYDVIYIDPPYNTGSVLTYKDKSTSSGAHASAQWLNEIYPRMKLARDVLEETGLMFVSIDDNEACHLLTILREIFGQENHLGTIKWRRKRKPSFLDKHLSATLEYIVIFARNAAVCPRLLGAETEESTRPVLNASNKDVERNIPEGMPAHCPAGEYAPGVYTNRSLGFRLLDQLVVGNGVVEKGARVVGPFRIQQDLWAQTGFITRNFGLRRNVLASEQKRRHAEDNGTHWPTNEDAQAELKAVFDGERVFDFPKPVGLLTELLSMVPHETTQRPQRCLDFYAGSGSFLIAALEQSRRDGIVRRVDLVQSRESVRGKMNHQFDDIAEICAHRVIADSRMRGFTPSFTFLELEQ